MIYLLRTYSKLSTFRSQPANWNFRQSEKISYPCKLYEQNKNLFFISAICTLCCDEKLKVTKDNMVWIHFDEMGCVQVGYQYFLNLNLKYSKSICVNEVRK